MAKVTRDIIGSTLSINADFREDQGQRKCVVKLTDSDSGGTTRAGTAILKAIENQSSHPEYGCSAPLRRASAVQIGADTFSVTLEYYHERAKYGNPTQLFSMSPINSRVNLPTSTVYKRAYRAGFDDYQYTDSGLPNGDNLFPNGCSKDVALQFGRSWFQPAFTLVVYGKINAGLAQYLEPTLKSAGVVNQQSFWYGNLQFAANSLRFDSVNVDYVDEDPGVGGLYYYLQYRFVYCPGGFKTQVITENPSTGVAEVEEKFMSGGPQANFSTLFPGAGSQ